MTRRTEKNLKYTLATYAAERMAPCKEAVRLCRESAEQRLD